jgi:hypothetical protein
MRYYASLLGALGLLALAAPAHADAPGVAGTLEQSATTSPKEKVAFADSALAEIDAAVKTVEKLLEQAEKEKNTEEIECLTRKLTPMRALYEVSQVSSNAMRQALAEDSSVHAAEEYRKVAVALTKTREFLAEAQACVGDTGVNRGATSSSVSTTGDGFVGEEAVNPDVLDGGDPGPDGTPQ